MAKEIVNISQNRQQQQQQQQQQNMKISSLIPQTASTVGTLLVLSTMQPSVKAQTCQTPLAVTPQPNTYSLDEYITMRNQCTALCNADGYCCDKDSGICNYAPCTTGCHIAWTTSSVQQCKQQCRAANAANCEVKFNYWNYEQVAAAGLSPTFYDGVDVEKCFGEAQCGCSPGTDSSQECSPNACERGCELANDRSIQGNFFNGQSVMIDPNKGLDSPSLINALYDLKAYVEGSLSLNDGQLNDRSIAFSQNKELLDQDETALVAAFAFVDAYESIKGPLFLNFKTSGGFYRQNAGDGLLLERIVFEVEQAILDEVYRTKTTVSERTQTTIIENCRNFLEGRTFQTAHYFPGWVDRPSHSKHNVQIEASKPTYWGMFVCFAEDPALKPTGMYLPPGGIATVTVPSALVNKGYQIRVGASDADHEVKDYHLRLDRISSIFEITGTTTHISSPVGGGVYIVVPYQADDGIVTISVSGQVIKAPMFSLTNIKTTTASEWNELKNSAAPWADFVTEQFFMQVPSSWIRDKSYTDILDLMTGRQEAMEAVSSLLGVPAYRRNDYFSYIQPDVNIRASAFGVGYPQINDKLIAGPEGPEPQPDHWMVTDKYSTFDGATYYHELGHCVMGWDYYEGETEAIVNVLNAFVRNTLVGLNLDQAVKFSVNEYAGFTPDQAFQHWAVTENFRSGNEMDKSNTEYDEFRYQERGMGKYIDIARIYGWDGFQKFNDLRQADTINGISNNGGLSNDDYRTLQLSRALGVDVTALIHFWGIHPDDPNQLKAEMKAHGLGPDNKIKDFLLQYVSIIPADNRSFQSLMYAVYPEIANQDWFAYYCESPLYGCGWFWDWKDRYNGSHGSQAKKAAESIIAKYFQ